MEVSFPPAPVVPLVSMPHLDTNDDETYDFVDNEGADDGPYTNAGQAVADLGFVVREEGGETETPGSETETPSGETETPPETPGGETDTPTDT